MFKKALVILLAVLLAFTLAACGGGDADDGAPAGPPDVDIELGEWDVTPNRFSVAAGDVTFNVSNGGGLPHELVVLKTDLAADGLVVADAQVDEGASGAVIGKIESQELPAGGSASATFNLAAGSYVLFCNIPAHYEQGMSVAFTVQ